MGQNGTLIPSSWDTANASAVFPVPGAPTSNKARPENLRDLMRSTTTPHAFQHCKLPKEIYRMLECTSRAFVCPTKPALSAGAKPSELSPSPFMCECGAIRDERPAEDVDGNGALCAGGADIEAGVEVVAFIVVNVEQRRNCARVRQTCEKYSPF